MDAVDRRSLLKGNFCDINGKWTKNRCKKGLVWDINLNLLFSFSLSASSYQQQRQASIQEDLNKLYDTRPTLASQYQRHSGKKRHF